MEIRWSNVAAMTLLLAALVLTLSHPERIGSFLGSVREAGEGHTLDDRTLSFFGLGLTVVGIVAVTKILSTSGRQGPGR